MGEKLQPLQFPSAAYLPNTKYFEIDSAEAGTRYAVLVTTPAGHGADPSKKYPVIYTSDGVYHLNLHAMRDLNPVEVITPYKPYILVSVGYVPSEAPSAFILRRRDLVPPGEKDSKLLVNAIQGFVDAGAFPQAVYDAFFATPPKADAHLRFFTKELHKQIVSRFSVDESDVALYGASYGGLFSLYALGKDFSIFSKFCAASPAVFDTDSVAFELLRENIAKGVDYSGRSLHISIGEKEFFSPGFYQQYCKDFVALIQLLTDSPPKGLQVTSEIIKGATHVDNMTAGFYDFVAKYYAA